MPRVSIKANSVSHIHYFTCSKCDFTSIGKNNKAILMIGRLHRKKCVPIEGKTKRSDEQTENLAKYVMGNRTKRGGPGAAEMYTSDSPEAQLHGQNACTGVKAKKIKDIFKTMKKNGRLLSQHRQKEREQGQTPEREASSFLRLHTPSA